MKKDCVILNDSDIRYGIIKISNVRDIIGENICGEITVKCKNEKIIANIPNHKGYIGRLGKFHKLNDAHDGTIVEIKKIAERQFELFYDSQNGDFKNDLFQNEDDIIEGIIESAKYKIIDHTWQFNNNEANVRAEIVDPILQALGWTFPDCVYREAQCQLKALNPSYGNVDYALYDGNKFQFIIETKSINSELNPSCPRYGNIIDNPKILFEILNDISTKRVPEDSDLEKTRRNPFVQLARYLKSGRFSNAFGILTNGYQWYFINQDLNKILSVNIDNPYFIEYMKMLRFPVSSETDIDFSRFPNVENTESSIIYHGGFKIENFEIIADKSFDTAVKTYADFIVNNYSNINIPEIVLEMQDKGLFCNPVVSFDKKRFGNYQELKCLNRTIYVNSYNSTFEKKMIVQQILDYIKHLDNH